VTTLATDIDGTVRRLTAAYGVHGLTKLASWNNATVGSGSVVNEVELVYNNFGQILQDRQAHDGVAGSGSPRVEYEYENGSANHVRLKKMVYPTNTSFVEPLYGSGGGQDDLLSRVNQLRFTKSGTPVTAAEYTYLGMDRPVTVDYKEPKVRFNLALGSGNYPYTALDRFDRMCSAAQQFVVRRAGRRRVGPWRRIAEAGKILELRWRIDSGSSTAFKSSPGRSKGTGLAVPMTVRARFIATAPINVLPNLPAPSARGCSVSSVFNAGSLCRCSSCCRLPDQLQRDYSTVTDLARLRGLSTSQPRATAM
jgi:hypothetical protein